jgi:hypothetical protein
VGHVQAPVTMFENAEKRTLAIKLLKVEPITARTI